jgi:hypothetical protein
MKPKKSKERLATEKVIENEMVDLLSHFSLQSPNTEYAIEFNIYEGCFVVKDYSNIIKKRYHRFQNAVDYLFENH